MEWYVNQYIETTCLNEHVAIRPFLNIICLQLPTQWVLTGCVGRLDFYLFIYLFNFHNMEMYIS